MTGNLVLHVVTLGVLVVAPAIAQGTEAIGEAVSAASATKTDNIRVVTAPGIWSDFRGPTRDGHAPKNARVPLTWSEQENVLWKTRVEGQGWSSPVIFDSRIFVTSSSDGGRKMSLIGVDLKTGKKVIDKVVFTNKKVRRKNRLNSYASPSAVVDERHVFVHFGSYGTGCFDVKTGKKVWDRRDMKCNHMEGPGSSPILWKDLLIINMDGGDLQYVIALDKRTGKTRWKQKRTNDLSKHPDWARKAYSTPIIIDVNDQLQLISSGAHCTFAYDPASGEPLWHYLMKGFSLSSRPLVCKDLLYLTTGYMPTQVHAIRPSGKGEIAEARAWVLKRSAPSMPSMVAVDDRLYLVTDDGGRMSCLDAKTGKRVWRKRIGDAHCASPIYASGRVYFFDRGGHTVVLKPGDKYQELAKNKLDSGCMASPAVVGNTLILRTMTHLYRIGEKKTEKKKTENKPKRRIR